MKRLPFLALVLLVGCAPSPHVEPRPPLDQSPAARWSYATRLLSQGDVTQALQYLEPLAPNVREVSDPALLMRDISEARLFSGDLAGASSAAMSARAELAKEPDTAQFNQDDRYLFERTIDALEAASHGDSQKLASLGNDRLIGPCADAAYLLGWLDEQHGDLSAAREAYRAYLASAPAWSFLREAFEMRHHAQLLVQ